MSAAELFRPLYREGRLLRLLDQRLLPGDEVWLELERAPEIAVAIRDMAVRGAPAIGVAAAYGAAFAIGEEDALFLVGQLANEAVDEAELDRVLGSLYAYVEQCFRPALAIGFASRLGGPRGP